EDATRITLIDAVCNGDLNRWARALAGRAAAARAVAGNGVERPGVPTDSPFDLRAMEEALASSAILGADTTSLVESARRIQRLDQSFERFRQTQVTEPALAD